MYCAFLRLSLAFLLVSLGFTASRADETLTYRWQGIDRTAILHIPEGAAGHAAPLAIVMYGSDDKAVNFQKNSGFDAVADRENFITLYPEAIDGAWNIKSKRPAINGEPVDDIGFFRTMIDDLVTRGIVDRERIYATGFSFGALMSYTLACALPDRIAAIAPVASAINEAQVSDCKTGHPMPVMMINGTGDEVQLYDGYIRSFGRLLSVPETTEYWRRIDGCTGENSKPLPHLNPHDLTRASLVQWSGCRANTGVELYRIENGGHCWPHLAVAGNGDPVDGPRFGGCSNDIETATEVWSFFKRYRLD
ncbi:alpha/beta hydrolase family esterase [Neorhizobium alkalisoli]|uniref:Polyhydroxybutyrate depolymerase n=1 Tax=Neorhizobium alkalisoli TaxID=528178 RepID=A0A561R3J1_9HYPH|nr:PHB depolymerase family esterase [Neorhizobium alkalisoli]TWF57185.1 polyhydroxybutyrate depolymerase [Neorhizobium alkalisoli]